MQDKLSGLYIVPTPIGNMDDITLRATRVLKNVDFIICEDTRVTNKLLTKLNISKKMFCYNDYSSEHDREFLLNKIKQAQSVALVSDAGTPLISDPGYKLIKILCEENIKVTSLPGSCSVITALTLSCLPTDRFMFLGFLPNKQAARHNLLIEIKKIQSTLVFFESPRRLSESITDLLIVLGNREATIVRELTKIYEEVRRGSLEELNNYYQENPDVKGEIIIIVAPPLAETQSQSIDKLQAEISDLIGVLSIKDIATKLASDYPSFSKKEIYDLAVSIKKKQII